MKKVLSLVLVLSIVLGSFGFAFAAPAAQVHAGDVLKGLGVLTGVNAAGDLDLDGPLNRQDMIVLLSRLLGAEDTAKSFGLKPSFTDVTVAFYVPYIAWAEANGYTNGIGGGKFGYGQDLTVQETLTLMMRALGYTPEWNAVPALAVELGLVENTNGMSSAASRGKMAELTLQALLTPMNGEEVTLGTFLGYEGFELEEVVVVPEELEVVSVSATNLKEIVVVFNQEVDETTVVNANFVVKQGTTTVTTTAKLLEDGKTVILTVGPAADDKLDNQGQYTLTVEKVKADELELAKTEKTFTAFDATLPVVEEVIVTGPNNLEIVFSEPIKSGQGSVQVKAGSTVIGVNPTFTGWGSNKIAVELFSSMVDGTTYSVTIKDFQDHASYNNVIRTVEVAYVKDVTPPVASVTKVEQEYVVVEFDKPVVGVTPAHFYHSFTAWTSIGVFSDEARTNSVNSTDKVSKVYVSFYAEGNTNSRPIPEGTTQFVVKAAANTVEIKDNWGNKFGETTFVVNVAADRTAPQVTELKVATERTLTIKFDKNVTFGPSNVEILKADGSTKTGVSISVSGSGKEYTITMGPSSFSGKTVLVRIKNVEDLTLNKNKLTLYSQTFEIADKTAPSVSSVAYEFVTDNNFMYVFFNEPVNATAVNKANYFLVKPSDSSLTAITGTPVFANDSKTVKIPLTNAQAALVNTDNYGLLVVGVEDVYENKLVGQTIVKGSMIAISAFQPQVTKAEVTAVDKLVLTYNQTLTLVEPGAYTVNGAAPAAMSLSLNDDGFTVVTLTTHADHKFTASNVTAGSYNVAPHATTVGSRVQNAFGTTAGTTMPGLADKVKPAVASIAFVDSTRIEINFTKTLSAATFATAANAKNGFSVAGGTLTSALIDGGVNGTKVILTGTDFTIATDVLYNGTNGVADTVTPANALAEFNRTTDLTAGALSFAITSPEIVVTTNYRDVLTADTNTATVAAVDTWVALGAGTDLEVRITNAALPTDMTNLILTPDHANNKITVTGTRTLDAAVASTVITVQVRDQQYPTVVKTFNVTVSATAGGGTALTIGSITQ